MSTDGQTDARILLAEGLANNDDPEIRQGFKKLIAKAYPKARAQMPDIVAEEVATEAEKRVNKRIEDWEKRQEQRDIADTTSAWRRKLTTGFVGPDKKTHKVEPADLPEIEKMMVERGNADAETAAYAYLVGKQVAQPVASRESRWAVPGNKGAGGDFFKGIMEDEHQWARDKATQIWDDIQAGRGQHWLESA